MDEILISEKRAASKALAGWRRLLTTALHSPAGEVRTVPVIQREVRTVPVIQRLRSLDAAWARFDKCHFRLMTLSVNLEEPSRVSEQEDWEARLEEYCQAREEGIELLKELGDTEHEEQREMPAGRSAQAGRPEHQQETHTQIGCFSRPKLPDEVLRQSAVRDDLVISGHKDFNSLYAANDTVQEKFTVNILGAPNNSTTTCGCDNINCPFCNLVKSISNRDPSLY